MKNCISYNIKFVVRKLDFFAADDVADDGLVERIRASRHQRTDRKDPPKKAGPGAGENIG